MSALYTAPYRLASTLRFYFWPKLSGRAVPSFRPTGVDGALGKAERDARREGKGACVRIVLGGCGAWVYVVVLGLCLAGAGATVKGALLDEGVSSSSSCPGDRWEEWAGRLMEGLVVRGAWPPIFLLWVVVVKNAWTPIRYAFAPPPFVEREQLLERKGKGKEGSVAYPKKEVRERHMEKRSQVFWLVVVAFLVGELLVFEASLGYSKATFWPQSEV